MTVLDERLLAQVAAGAAAGAQRLPRCPAVPVPVDAGVRLVRTAAEAEGMLDQLSLLPVAFMGLGVELQEASLNEGADAAVDPSRLAPLALGLAAAVSEGEGTGLVSVRYVVDVRNREVLSALERVLRLPVRFVVHGLRPAYGVLRALGLPWPRSVFCTRLAARLLTLGRWHVRYVRTGRQGEAQAAREARARRQEETSLLALAARHGVALPPAASADEVRARLRRAPAGSALAQVDGEALCAEAHAATALHGALRAALVAAGLDAAYDAVELPGALSLADIEWNGVTVDRARMHLAREAAARAVAAYEVGLRAWGFTDPRSPVERARILEQLGLLPAFRAAGGPPVFDEDALEAHRDLHPAVDLLYRHARYGRLRDDPLLAGAFTGSDGRVRPRIESLGAESGRITLERGNLAGVSRILRPVVTPDGPAHGLVELDYVAQEPGLAAAHFGDAQLLADCAAGDPYLRMVRTLCVGELAPGDGEALTDAELVRRYPELRKRMKLLMLAMLYGMGDAALAAQARTDVAGARRLRSAFFERYPQLKRGMERAVQQLGARGYAEGPTGLKRYRGAAGPLSPWETRWAVNSVIQGAGATVLKLLLPRLSAFLAPHGARVVLPIFDAVLIQVPLREGRVPKDIVEGTRALMEGAMRELYPASHPRVDVNAVDPRCWNKDGHNDSIERFLADPMFRL